MQALHGAADAQPVLPVPGEAFALRKLLPQTPHYDFNVHVMDFQPGEYLNVKEVRARPCPNPNIPAGAAPGRATKAAMRACYECGSLHARRPSGCRTAGRFGARGFRQAGSVVRSQSASLGC